MTMGAAVSSRLVWVGIAALMGAALLPLIASGYVLGLLTVAYYTAVFAMSWDLLFGFAGEVNFGPTFLIGLGAYTARNPRCEAVACSLDLDLRGRRHGRRGRGRRHPRVARTAPARTLFRTHDAGRGLDAAELRRRVRRLDRRRDRPLRPGRRIHRRACQLLDRVRLHGRQRRHPVRPVTLGDRADPAGQRPRCRAGGRPRFQRGQAQACRLHRPARFSQAWPDR